VIKLARAFRENDASQKVGVEEKKKKRIGHVCMLHIVVAIFGPYFCQNYLIWFLFSLCGQFGPHFCKIAFNQILLANSVKIVNGTVIT